MCTISAIFYEEIIYYALHNYVIKKFYYPYLVKALKHLDKGTYKRICKRLLKTVKERGLNPKTFEMLVNELKKVIHTDVFLLAKAFETDLRRLLDKYNISGMESGIYYAFAFKIKRIVSMFKGEERKRQIQINIKYFNDAYYCNEKVLHNMATLVEKYYDKIDEKIRKDIDAELRTRIAKTS